MMMMMISSTNGYEQTHSRTHRVLFKEDKEEEMTN